MNREEFFKFHKECTEKMYAITNNKNRDYAGPAGDNPFSNFSRVAALDICSVESGFLVRMLDKICRINSFVQTGTLHVTDELIEDTLLDLANYAILFAGYLKSEKETTKEDVRPGPIPCDVCGSLAGIGWTHPISKKYFCGRCAIKGGFFNSAPEEADYEANQ